MNHTIHKQIVLTSFFCFVDEVVLEEEQEESYV